MQGTGSDEGSAALASAAKGASRASVPSAVKSLAGEAHYFEETINVRMIRNARARLRVASPPPSPLPPQIGQVKKLLDNKVGQAGEQEKLEGMKWLLAVRVSWAGPRVGGGSLTGPRPRSAPGEQQISKGRDVSQFFADVVKIVIVKSVEVKKLAYMYLTHYAVRGRGVGLGARAAPRARGAGAVCPMHGRVGCSLSQLASRSQDANATCRELALLSIASFQKDLNDTNQVRALACWLSGGVCRDAAWTGLPVAAPTTASA